MFDLDELIDRADVEILPDDYEDEEESGDEN